MENILKAIRDWCKGLFAKKTDITAKTDGTSLSEIKFGVDDDGNYGYYKAGADSVTPFKTGDGGEGIFPVNPSDTSKYNAWIETDDINEADSLRVD